MGCLKIFWIGQKGKWLQTPSLSLLLVDWFMELHFAAKKQPRELRIYSFLLQLGSKSRSFRRTRRHIGSWYRSMLNFNIGIKKFDNFYRASINTYITNTIILKYGQVLLSIFIQWVYYENWTRLLWHKVCILGEGYK